MLRPTLIFVILTSTIGGLQIFDEPRMFTEGTSGYGGSNNQFLTVSLYLWDLGFNKTTIGQPNMGRSAAVAWLLFLIVVVFAIVNYLLTQRIASSGGKPRTKKKSAKKVSA